MRKILTLVGMLSLSTCAVNPIIACSNQETDGTLKTISSGETEYEGWSLTNNIGINKPNVPGKDQTPKATQEITKNNLVILVQTLAQMIVTKADSTNNILWFDASLNEGAKCYNFSIDNGTASSTTIGNKTWDVNGTTGRIAVDITYQVGVVTKDKAFQSQQQVKVTFKLKCDYTQSDYMVYKTVKSITKIPSNTLTVTITDKDKPKVKAKFTDLSSNLHGLIQTELVKQTKADNPFVNSVVTIQKGINNEVVSEQLIIKITFNVQFQDSFIDMAKNSSYDNSTYDPTTIQFKVS